MDNNLKNNNPNILGKRIRIARENLGLSQTQLCHRIGYTSRSAITKIENGTNLLTQPKIEKIAEALNVSPAYLMGWEDNPSGENKSTKIDIFQFENITPLTTKKIPILGEVACGKPIFVEEDRESYLELGVDIKADFGLYARGDSMIGARIYNGDLVLCRKQPTVNNGEIAVVIIGDEATLKRVYFYPEKQKLILQAENPKYEPLIYEADELQNIRILGKAVGAHIDIH